MAQSACNDMKRADAECIHNQTGKYSKGLICPRHVLSPLPLFAVKKRQNFRTRQIAQGLNLPREQC